MRNFKIHNITITNGQGEACNLKKLSANEKNLSRSVLANQWSEVYLGSVVIKGFWTTGNNKISITNRFYFCAFKLRRISEKTTRWRRESQSKSEIRSFETQLGYDRIK